MSAATLERRAVGKGNAFFLFGFPPKLALLFFLCGCASPSSSDKAGPAELSAALEAPATEGPETLATFRAELSSNYVERARKLSEILIGRPIEALPAEATEERGMITWVDVGNTPGVIVTYTPLSDDLLVRNIRVEGDYEGLLASEPISEDDARQVFYDVIDRLAESGLVDRASLDLGNVNVGTTKHFAASSDEPLPEPQILDYRFRVKRQLGGMQLRNSLVRAGVTRRGEVGSLRLLRGGFTFSPEGEVPRQVGSAACADRFESEFPAGVIEREGEGYFLPLEFTEPVVISPQCYFAFTERYEVDGETSLSRGKDVRYSLADASAHRLLLGEPDETN